jgi:formylglycine-generating enzyme required for sulfatase activity
MKKSLAILLMLLINVGCDDSPQTQQSTEQGFDLEGSSVDEQPDEAEQPTKPVPVDPPVVELPSITNTIGMKFNKIPAGTFMMGSPETEEGRQDDEHQHQVTITKPFYMQTTEVTQGQWTAVMGTEPWKGKRYDPDGPSYVKEGPSYAASYVTWEDAVAFCKKLSEKEGKTYRLPTEAEWEYACRAGTTTTWSFGDDEKALGDYAWYDKNAAEIVSERYAHQVGLKKPNAFGLYDMHGNVYEWCHDYYGEDYYKQSSEIAKYIFIKDPTGPVTGSDRVLRGGSWIIFARLPRSAVRGRLGAVWRYDGGGFRLVRELD